MTEEATASGAARAADAALSSPRITVIIPVLNAADTLGCQLKALSEQVVDVPWELIVADNGCTDGSLDVARTFGETLRLRVVDASTVRGAAHARNVGALAANAPLLAFVDADDMVAPGWLAAMIAALERHPAVASRFGGDHLNPPQLRFSRGLAQERGLAVHDYATFLPHAGGSGLGVNRRVHDQIGGFDERLLVLEDTDYVWRLQLAGHRLHFEPDALLHVRFRATPKEMVRQAFRYGRHNGWLYRKYLVHGMQHVSVGGHLRRLVSLLLRLPLRLGDRAAVLRHLRALANSFGILVGRIEGRWRLR